MEVSFCKVQVRLASGSLQIIRNSYSPQPGYLSTQQTPFHNYLLTRFPNTNTIKMKISGLSTALLLGRAWVTSAGGGGSGCSNPCSSTNSDCGTGNFCCNFKKIFFLKGIIFSPAEGIPREGENRTGGGG